MDALKIAFVTVLVDDGDPPRHPEGKRGPRMSIFDVRAEIAEGVGMAPLDDGIGVRG
jgi:hypothetical protein